MDEEKKQEQPYQFTPEGGEPTNSSKDYTGKGTAVYPNGEQYEGLYVNGVREGQGKYTYSNGDVYNGIFKDNKKHGIGRLVYADKSEYYGEWQNGNKHGEGMYIYQNKDVYSGGWAFGKKHGTGTYVFNATAMKYVGEWFEGKFLKGRWVYPNGTCYEGEFQNNKPKGVGNWQLWNGNRVKGHYDQVITTKDNSTLETELVWTKH